MKADQFKKQLQKGEIPRVCLLYGEEPLLIQENLDLLRKKLSTRPAESLAEELFYGSDADSGSILLSAKTLPLFGSEKLIVVKGIDRMPDAHRDRLLDLVDNPVPGTYVALTAEKPDMRKKFYARLGKKWPSVRFYHPYDQRQAQVWIRSYLRARGFQIDDRGAEFLCEAHGRELQVLRNELDKAMLFMGKAGRIGVSELAQVSGQSKEFNPFEFTDVLVERDFERAIAIFSRMRDLGVPVLLIVSVLAAKLRKLWMGKAFERQGYSEKEILAALKINFLGNRFLRQLRGLREEEVEQIYESILRIDEAIKTGQGRPEVWLEVMIFRICRGH